MCFRTLEQLLGSESRAARESVREMGIECEILGDVGYLILGYMIYDDTCIMWVYVWGYSWASLRVSPLRYIKTWSNGNVVVMQWDLWTNNRWFDMIWLCLRMGIPHYISGLFNGKKYSDKPQDMDVPGRQSDAPKIPGLTRSYPNVAPGKWSNIGGEIVIFPFRCWMFGQFLNLLPPKSLVHMDFHPQKILLYGSYWYLLLRLDKIGGMKIGHLQCHP